MTTVEWNHLILIVIPCMQRQLRTLSLPSISVTNIVLPLCLSVCLSVSLSLSLPVLMLYQYQAIRRSQTETETECDVVEYASQVSGQDSRKILQHYKDGLSTTPHEHIMSGRRQKKMNYTFCSIHISVNPVIRIVSPPNHSLPESFAAYSFVLLEVTCSPRGLAVHMFETWKYLILQKSKFK